MVVIKKNKPVVPAKPAKPVKGKKEVGKKKGAEDEKHVWGATEETESEVVFPEDEETDSDEYESESDF